MSESSEEFDMETEDLLEENHLEQGKPDTSKQGGYRDYSKDEKALNSKKMIYRTHDQSMFKDKKLSLPNSSSNLQVNILKKKKSSATNHFSQQPSHNHMPYKDYELGSETSLEFAQLIPMRTPKTQAEVHGTVDARIDCEEHFADLEQMQESKYLSGPPGADLLSSWPQIGLNVFESGDLPPTEGEADMSEQPTQVFLDARIDRLLLSNPSLRESSKALEHQSPTKKQLLSQKAYMNSSRSQRFFTKSFAKINTLDQSHESEDELPEGTPKNYPSQATSHFSHHYVKPDAGEPKKSRAKKSMQDRSLNMGAVNKTFDQTHRRKLFDKDKASAASLQTNSRFMNNTLHKVLELNKDKNSINRSMRLPADMHRKLDVSHTESQATDSLTSGDTSSLQIIGHQPKDPHSRPGLFEMHSINDSDGGKTVNMKLPARAKRQMMDGLVREINEKGIYPFQEADLVESVCARVRFKATFEDSEECEQVLVCITIKPGNRPETKELVKQLFSKVSELYAMHT